MFVSLIPQRLCRIRLIREETLTLIYCSNWISVAKGFVVVNYYYVLVQTTFGFAGNLFMDGVVNCYRAIPIY